MPFFFFFLPFFNRFLQEDQIPVEIKQKRELGKKMGIFFFLGFGKNWVTHLGKIRDFGKMQFKN